MNQPGNEESTRCSTVPFLYPPAAVMVASSALIDGGAAGAMRRCSGGPYFPRPSGRVAEIVELLAALAGVGAWAYICGLILSGVNYSGRSKVIVVRYTSA